MERLFRLELSGTDLLLLRWDLHSSGLVFPNQLMPDALYFLTLIKIGSAGLAFWFYASQTFKIQRWQHVTLAVCYALMSFITAHSELIMWLDAMIYLPLVILGIDRLVKKKKPVVLFISYLLLFYPVLHGLYDRSLFRDVFLGSVGAQLEASSGGDHPLRHHLLVSWRRLNGDHLTCLIGFALKRGRINNDFFL